MTLSIRPTTNIATYHEMLDQKAKEYFDKAKADNTKKSYRSDWEDFEVWSKDNKLCPMPAEVKTVIRYITARATHPSTRIVCKRKGRGKNMRLIEVPVEFQPLSYSSIERRLSAISKAHQYAGHRFDRKNAILAEVLNGIKREKGTAQVQKTALLTDDIRTMVQGFEGIQGVRDRAIILLGFTGAFRRSEIVGLQLADLKETKEGFEAIVRFSKTDQEGEGHIKAIPYGKDPQTCPVKSIRAWCAALHNAGIHEGPLFRAVDRHENIRKHAMCSAAIALIIKRNDHIKDRSIEFGGHSLRAGFCTQAALNDVPDSLAMLQSGHRDSNTYRKYVRVADRWKNSAAKKLGL
jgi:site-specific recombinase XerD